MMDPLLRQEKEAELALLEIKAARLRAELTAAPSTKSGAAFDPAWKSGIRLSAIGEQAVLAAFDARKTLAQVAATFQISRKAARNWRERWEAKRNV